MNFMLRIVVLVSFVVAFAAARESIIFNGIVQDESFEAGEKLNVEILETGEALQTTVGTPFSVVLPEDTLWNVCVTNSDTAGAEKEKCYELVYLGSDSTFSLTLGEKFAEPAEAIASDSASQSERDKSGEKAFQGNPEDSVNSSSLQAKGAATSDSSSDVDVEKLLAASGSNSKVTELKKVVVQLRRRPKRKPGESVVSAKSIKRMPGLAEADVIKSIQALPGGGQ